MELPTQSWSRIWTFVLTVDASGVVFGQTSDNVAWKVYTPGRPLQKVVLPDSHILFGVNEKGVAVVTASDRSEPDPAVAHPAA